MSKRFFGPISGPRMRLVGLALLAAQLMACNVKSEQGIPDPDCEHCYRLESGVKYKTFEYYDP